MPERQRAELTALGEALRAAADYHPDLDRPPVVLSLPFAGSWLAVNTPARRIPSHGTHFLGQTFAIDSLLWTQNGVRRPYGTGGHSCRSSRSTDFLASVSPSSRLPTAE